MLRIRLFIFIILAFVFQLNSIAQNAIDKDEVIYETVYDDPYDINQLYIQVQPIYGEFFTTNTNIGFGIEADYYLKDVFDFNINGRIPYGTKFDMMRDAAKKNSDVENKPSMFYFLELGGTYHIVDKEVDSKAKFILYSKNFKRQNRWESMVPKNIEAPIKLRTIYGLRFGATAYQSTIHVNDILSRQGYSFNDSSSLSINDASVYTSIVSQGFFIGGALDLIKNVAIAFDKSYDQAANDLLFTAYLDLLFNPFITIDDIYYRPEPDSPQEVYSSDIIETTDFGFRGGIKGKFNRRLSFGYRVELGLRPGVKGRNFYLIGVIGIPVFGARLGKNTGSFE